jgi:DNA-binding LacI/PurR family transcriptional regulator
LSVLGLRVPEDIDLASMDDARPYDLLAAVEGILPSEEMARKAMDLLVQRMTSGRLSAGGMQEVQLERARRRRSA